MGEDALKLTTLLLLLLTGCATSHAPDATLSVGEVWARHHQLDGSVIRVRGVVTRCYPLGCLLRESRNDGAKWLGIGTSDQFDDAVQAYLRKPIIVEGKLRADCLHLFADPKSDSGELIICSDRASMLMDPKLVGHRH